MKNTHDRALLKMLCLGVIASGCTAQGPRLPEEQPASLAGSQIKVGSQIRVEPEILVEPEIRVEPETRAVSENSVDLANVGKMDYLAAINLVNTIVQVPRLHPGAVGVVQMHEPTRRFGRYVTEVMNTAGYTIEYVSRSQKEAPFLSLSRTLGPIMSTYKIGINEFKIRRSYTIEEDLVLPVSSIYVFGADPDAIEIDDTIFEVYEPASEVLGVNAIQTSLE